jgi:hypothetical protein
LAEGLALLGAGWLLLGAGLAAALAAVAGPEVAWSAGLLGRLTAGLGVAYVAGFVMSLPGGLGVREFFLTLFLVPELTAGGMPAEVARGTADVTVVLLRLVWTAAELLLAALIYWLPFSRGSANRG